MSDSTTLDPTQLVAIIGGSGFALIAVVVCGLALCWDEQSGFSRFFRRGEDSRRAFNGREAHRFDASLFLWTMAYLVGSAVWLRSITNGDQFGRGVTFPLWKEHRPERFWADDFFHPLSDDADELRPRVTGFEISVDQMGCNYTTQEDADEPRSRVDFCGDDRHHRLHTTEDGRVLRGISLDERERLQPRRGVDRDDSKDG